MSFTITHNKSLNPLRLYSQTMTQYKLKATRYQLSYINGRVGIFIDRVEVRDQAGNYQRDAQLHKLVEHLHNRTLDFAPLPDHK
jgi:hypothetical protein